MLEATRRNDEVAQEERKRFPEIKLLAIIAQYSGTIVCGDEYSLMIYPQQAAAAQRTVSTSFEALKRTTGDE
jgi:hypothetical protein